MNISVPNLPRCFRMMRGTYANTRTQTSSTVSSTSVLPADVRRALDRVFKNPVYLREACFNGQYVKAKIWAPHMSYVATDNEEVVQWRMPTCLLLTFEHLLPRAHLPLDRLQSQAWRYLHRVSSSFPDELQASWRGNISGGIFTGRKAFQELLILHGITEEITMEELWNRMLEEGGGDAGWAGLMRGITENMFKDEVKIHAAVALSCFGGEKVIDFLRILLKAKGDSAEQLRDITKDVLLRLSHFSPLALGVLYAGENVLPNKSYPGIAPEELVEDVMTLRYSGHALAIARKLDHFYNDPANVRHFHEVRTSLPVWAAEQIGFK